MVRPPALDDRGRTDLAAAGRNAPALHGLVTWAELIMPLAGFTAARGDLDVAGVVAAGTGGSMAGALVWYCAGRWLGCERLKRLAARHGRWLTVNPAEIDTAAAWFRRHCGASVFLGRLVPTVRTLISVPAGITGMSLGRFLVYSSLGTAIWTGLLTSGGYLLKDQYRSVSSWMNPVSNVVFGVIAVWYVYRVATFRREPGDASKRDRVAAR